MTTNEDPLPGGGRQDAPLVRLGITAAAALAAGVLIIPAAKAPTGDPAGSGFHTEAIGSADPAGSIVAVSETAVGETAVGETVEPPAGLAAGAPYLDVAMAEVAPPIDKTSGVVLQVGTAADLAEKFAAIDYTFDAVREANVLVPRVFLTSFPEDMEELQSVDDRKKLFLRTMLPLVLRVNEAVLHDRWRLLGLRDRLNAGETLDVEDLRWLIRLAGKYRLKKVDMDELLLRVDAVPPSMALAQSAVESGWGTSRFALQGNAVFGQITFSPDGIVPLNRKPGETHLFAAFDGLIDGTRSYVRNLNTHRAYAEFREMRAEQRAEGDRLDGAKLLGGLLSYSELGQDYVDYVRGVIRTNDLHLVDRARLSIPGGQLTASAI